MKTRSIGKKNAAGSKHAADSKTAAGNEKIHAVKPPKPAKRTWTVTLPQEIADLVENQYQVISRNAPGEIKNTQDFVRGLVFAGIAAISTTFSMVDQLVDIDEKHSGMWPAKNRRGAWKQAVSIMDPAKAIHVIRDTAGMLMSYRGKEIDLGAAPKSPALRVVMNKITPIKSASAKRAKKPKTGGPPDAA